MAWASASLAACPAASTPGLGAVGAPEGCWDTGKDRAGGRCVHTLHPGLHIDPSPGVCVSALQTSVYTQGCTQVCPCTLCTSPLPRPLHPNVCHEKALTPCASPSCRVSLLWSALSSAVPSMSQLAPPRHSPTAASLSPCTNTFLRTQPGCSQHKATSAQLCSTLPAHR